MARDIFNQIRLLRDPSNLAWNISRGGSSMMLLLRSSKDGEMQYSPLCDGVGAVGNSRRHSYG